MNRLKLLIVACGVSVMSTASAVTLQELLGTHSTLAGKLTFLNETDTTHSISELTLNYYSASPECDGLSRRVRISGTPIVLRAGERKTMNMNAKALYKIIKPGLDIDDASVSLQYERYSSTCYTNMSCDNDTQVCISRNDTLPALRLTIG